jgi:transposase
MDRRSVINWCRRHAGGGDGAVAARRRRRPLSGPLSRTQELDLVESLRGRFPDQIGLDGRLWTRQNVAALIDRTYGVRVSVSAVARYLRSWGLGPREPVDRACALCADAVTNWLAKDYTTIVYDAQQSRADLWWVGRSRLHGLTPATEIISAVSTRGWLRFAVGADPGLSRRFLNRLPTPPDRATHVVIDGSWAGSDWPRRVPDGVVLHALPSCERGR